MSRSTAYRFLDVAEAFGAELPILGSLPVDVVQKLARRSTPPELRASVVGRIKAGADLNPDTILAKMRYPPRVRTRSADAEPPAPTPPERAAVAVPEPVEPAREVKPGSMDEAARIIVAAMGGRRATQHHEIRPRPSWGSPARS